MTTNPSVLITNARSIIGIMDEPYVFKKAEALSHVGKIDNGYVYIEGNHIVDYGSQESCPYTADIQIDAKRGLVLPSWVDSHTHIVFATSREEEFVMRIKGKSYEEIAQSGGGILNSARKLRNTSEEELYLSARGRLEEVIASGTGAIEIKSGYGLSYESELKMLRIIKRLKNESKALIKASFLAAHAVPEAYKNNRKEYINLIINKMLPEVAKESLADYCDVFCDVGFFTIEETDRILKAANKYGLKGKIHANELANSGGVQIGIENNAISVDHLERIEAPEIEALRNSNTIPTLLPGTSYFLGIPYAPARKMIDSGLGVVLASDYNPGSTPSGNIPFLMSLACTQMKMTPNEAFNAVTINAAHALELGHLVGSISKGKLANLIITQPMDSIDFIPYAYGTNHISKVLLQGKLI